MACGSVAGFHGHARLTADIDLIVDLATEQATKLIDTLDRLGYQPQAPVASNDFAKPDIRAMWIREKNMEVFSLVDHTNPMRVVDLFIKHPIPFDDLWNRSIIVALDSVSVRIASIPDLIHLKRLAGRPQDHDDIQKLEEIQRLSTRDKHE